MKHFLIDEYLYECDLKRALIADPLFTFSRLKEGTRDKKPPVSLLCSPFTVPLSVLLLYVGI